MSKLRPRDLHFFPEPFWASFWEYVHYVRSGLGFFQTCHFHVFVKTKTAPTAPGSKRLEKDIPRKVGHSFRPEPEMSRHLMNEAAFRTTITWTDTCSVIRSVKQWGCNICPSSNSLWPETPAPDFGRAILARIEPIFHSHDVLEVTFLGMNYATVFGNRPN